MIPKTVSAHLEVDDAETYIYLSTLLGIDDDLADKYQEQLTEDPELDRHHLRRRFEGSTQEILRPGVVRLSFPYFMDDKAVDFIVRAVCAVADFGHTLLPDYTFNPEDAIWTHVNYVTKLSKNRTWLGNISYAKGVFDVKAASKFTSRNRKVVTDKDGNVINIKSNDDTDTGVFDLDAVYEEGLALLQQGSTVKGLQRSSGATISQDASWLRWYSNPEEGKASAPTGPVCPFTPKVYDEVSSTASSAQEPILYKSCRETYAAPHRDSQADGGGVAGSIDQDSAAPDEGAEGVREAIGGAEGVREASGGAGRMQDSTETVKEPQTQTQLLDFTIEPFETPVCLLPRKPKSAETADGDGAGDGDEGEVLDTELLEEGNFTLDLFDDEDAMNALKTTKAAIEFKEPPTKLFRTFQHTIMDMDMIKDGDSILLCISGGKDSLSMLHLMRQYQIEAAKRLRINFTFGCATVDPQTEAFDPSPLIDYMKALDVPYFFMSVYANQITIAVVSQDLIAQAANIDPTSLCSYCARMKRGMLYTCARKNGYNVLAFGQHLDDLAESFMMSVLFNGMCRTMKANYTVTAGDLRMIRPMVNIRERDLREFADTSGLPIINENCPACFSEPTERMRMKQVLGSLELLHPHMFHSIAKAIRPLVAIDRTGLETGQSAQAAALGVATMTGDDVNSDVDD
ncbi:hypothetical protein SARC_03943 [Sphaeroforma arctica JP610]|uniref:tRNA(Ile)-lysidine/2-thiocytidine synthase N-terminal domain-containing protein n=1 Tax=Sphaeroforma arctica JP610 TaxID=667725 RepID=A0A0L0G4J1_9EUKA|nr:hypothetical protein SARC_03943 [Sphaeroforma arctica JP610]KNC83814.1 hypothetical protein SARC_03943 [Sphaeroforma arctica JP610]|eukprot:XP_014157716.1 hypothetical protein SARC_03943 [Sphaeroforma arctica JP610]